MNYKHSVKVILAGVGIAVGIVTIDLAGQQSANRYTASRSVVAPRQELVKSVIDEAYAKFKDDTGGKNADYIPYLAKVDSNLFGIAVVTTDDQSYAVGDVNYSFSIQSISKVFTLALAMQDLGAEKVF